MYVQQRDFLTYGVEKGTINKDLFNVFNLVQRLLLFDFYIFYLLQSIKKSFKAFKYKLAKGTESFQMTRTSL